MSQANQMCEGTQESQYSKFDTTELHDKCDPEVDLDTNIRNSDLKMKPKKSKMRKDNDMRLPTIQ